MARYQQSHRILQLVSMLENNPQGLTAEEIYERFKEHFNVTKRSIYRDIESLETSGFPITLVDPDSKKHRWKLERTVKIGRTLVLSPREVLVLFLSKSAFKPFEHTPFFEDLSSLFMKIEVLLGKNTADYLTEMSDSYKFEAGPKWGLGTTSDVVDTVRACCEEGQILSVEYRSQNSATHRVRRLGPQFLYFAQGSIYLVAEDLENGQVKVFSLPRMSQPRMLDEEYKGVRINPESFFENSLGIFRSDKVTEIKLRFSPKLSSFVQERRWHPSQRTVPQADGSVLIYMSVGVSVELYNWILNFGDNVEVLGPNEVRQELCHIAENIVIKYKGKKAA
jgi:predicted DNA-binding transcriptional regulator YafY